MAKFLTTNQISVALEDLINSGSDIYLISPYVSVSQRLLEFIQDADKKGTRFTIIYRNGVLKPSEKQWIYQLTRCRVLSVENLHAKCYFSEGQAIVTSMNLYEFSQQNNSEMGISITRAYDRDLYEDIRQEVCRLIRIGEKKRTSSDFAGPLLEHPNPIVKEMWFERVHVGLFRDVVNISWEPPETQRNIDQYQIQLRKCGSSEWYPYSDICGNATQYEAHEVDKNSIVGRIKAQIDGTWTEWSREFSET